MAKERRVGRWTDTKTGNEWRVEKWTYGRQERNIEDNRLTRSALDESDRTTFAIALPSGRVVYRTFTGQLPDDIQVIMDYWRDIKSI